MAETPYAETEALLHMLKEDVDSAKAILADMYPVELGSFIEALTDLTHYAREARRVKLKEREASR